MNLIVPYAKLVDIQTQEDGIKLLKKIEWAARVSHRSEEAQTDTSYDRFLRAVVLGHGDWSVVEHASATVEFYVDRGITHELVRHRLFSWTQESTRFVSYEKKMPPSFVVPPLEPSSVGISSFSREEDRIAIWKKGIEAAEDAYLGLIKQGCAPQIARSVFPNALASKIIMTGNLRSFRHFLVMRTTKESHPQMREVTIPLLAQFKERIPILYEDIEPMARQADNVRLPK